MDNSTLLINDDASTGYSKADLLIIGKKKDDEGNEFFKNTCK